MSIDHGWVDDLRNERDALWKLVNKAVEWLDDLNTEVEKYTSDTQKEVWWSTWKAEAEELLDATAD